jgi:predicted  nucleic acid-binding Zn-ribbon protein
MSILAPLLETQDLDLETDAVRKRAAELPERAMLPKLAGKITRAEEQLAAERTRRGELEAAEHALGASVSQVAREIEAAEVERYSGKRKGRDGAAEHDASQQALRDKQVELEEQEMALLESIEAVEERIREVEARLASYHSEQQLLMEAIRKVEGEFDAEIERLSSARSRLAAPIPPDVLAAYERVRAQPRSGGRGATLLSDGRCTGCRIQLPSLERKRMLAEPEEALMQCPQCRRVLVRE